MKIQLFCRAISNIACGLAQILYAPRKAKDFLAHVYRYDPLPYSSRIKGVAWEALFSDCDEKTVALRHCTREYGNMSFEEIVAMCLLVQQKSPHAIFEFGTFRGVTTLQLALNTGTDCRIYTLNLPPDMTVTAMPLGSFHRDMTLLPSRTGSGTVFSGQPEAAKIEQLVGDSAVFDFTPYHGRCGVVFIDACHEYAYVKSDTIRALRLLPREGGLIVWHDFPTAPGVKAWLEEMSATYEIRHIKDTRLAFAMVNGAGEIKPS